MEKLNVECSIAGIQWSIFWQKKKKHDEVLIHLTVTCQKLENLILIKRNMLQRPHTV